MKIMENSVKLLYLGTLVVTLSFFVACSNDDGDFSEGTSSSLATDTAWYNSSQTEFVITTAEALAGFAELVNDGNDFAGKTIKLGANIMLNDTTSWENWVNSPPAKKWTPIGAHCYSTTSYHALTLFNGIFDGYGHIVSGIYTNRGDYQGLFGCVGPGGVIKDIGVTASYIGGSGYTGGLVGDNRGLISSSYFIGIVNVQFGECVGGLVGQNWNGEIGDSYSAGAVIGGNVLGGLVGSNYGAINNSYSTSTVTGKGSIGGLIGTNRPSGGSADCHTINDSYSTGTVMGENRVGGFVGNNDYCAIVNSYSTGSVAGKDNVGGFAGSGSASYSYSTGIVTGENNVGGLVGSGGASYSYSTGAVTGKDNVGGLVGSGVASYSYSTGIVTGENNVGGLVGSNNQNWGSVINGWDFDNIWGINNTKNHGYPYLLILF